MHAQDAQSQSRAAHVQISSITVWARRRKSVYAAAATAEHVLCVDYAHTLLPYTLPSRHTHTHTQTQFCIWQLGISHPCTVFLSRSCRQQTGCRPISLFYVGSNFDRGYPARLGTSRSGCAARCATQTTGGSRMPGTQAQALMQLAKLNIVRACSNSDRQEKTRLARVRVALTGSPSDAAFDHQRRPTRRAGISNPCASAQRPRTILAGPRTDQSNDRT